MFTACYRVARHRDIEIKWNDIIDKICTISDFRFYEITPVLCPAHPICEFAVYVQNISYTDTRIRTEKTITLRIGS
jgi:hypothetical protein